MTLFSHASYDVKLECLLFLDRMSGHSTIWYRFHKSGVNIYIVIDN